MMVRVVLGKPRPQAFVNTALDCTPSMTGGSFLTPSASYVRTNPRTRAPFYTTWHVLFFRCCRELRK